jgi:hypothetical protein
VIDSSITVQAGQSLVRLSRWGSGSSRMEDANGQRSNASHGESRRPIGGVGRRPEAKDRLRAHERPERHHRVRRNPGGEQPAGRSAETICDPHRLVGVSGLRDTQESVREESGYRPGRTPAHTGRAVSNPPTSRAAGRLRRPLVGIPKPSPKVRGWDHRPPTANLRRCLAPMIDSGLRLSHRAGLIPSHLV